MKSLLELDGIVKSFPSPSGGSIGILSGVDLAVHEGEVVSIVGRSGSGKSTLLAIAALLMKPDSGRILYSGQDTSSMDERAVDALRSRAMGFVFQSAQLLKDFSALENAAMPLMIQGMCRKEALEKAADFLAMMGLEGRMDHRSAELSGGERQRTAIARALAGSPLVVFADEPTGSLDEKSAAATEDMLLDAVHRTGHCMLLVTHNRAFAERADRMLELKEGVLVDL